MCNGLLFFLSLCQLGDYCPQNFCKHFDIVFVGAFGYCCCYSCRPVICLPFSFEIIKSNNFQFCSNYFLKNVRISSSTGQTKDNSYWRQNETSFVMTGISFFFPTCFEILGLLEKYHPRKQLRWQLGRYDTAQ